MLKQIAFLIIFEVDTSAFIENVMSTEVTFMTISEKCVKRKAQQQHSKNFSSEWVPPL